MSKLGANRPHLGVALAVALLSTVETLLVYPRLPDPMASNFGGDGTPGGWSSKTMFVGMHLASLVVLLGVLVAIPTMVDRARDKLEGRTLRWLRDAAGWFLIATTAFSSAVVHLVYVANLETGRLSDGFVWLLAVYLLYTIVWIVRLVRRLRREGYSR